MKEKDILHECGDYWVLKQDNKFYVMKNGQAVATSICCFDEITKAIKYTDYMGSK